MKPKMMLYCEAEDDAVYSACRAHQHIEAEFGEKHTQVQFADIGSATNFLEVFPSTWFVPSCIFYRGGLAVD